MLPERKNAVDFHLPLTCPPFSNIFFFQIIMTFFFSAFPFFKPFLVFPRDQILGSSCCKPVYFRSRAR